jgi:hypothetical protein
MRYSRISCLIAIATLYCFTYASAQPHSVLNGSYASEGTGTIAGQPVAEISHWKFAQGKLQALSQVINIGGVQASGFVNTAGQQIGFCKFSVDAKLNAPPLPYATIDGLGTSAPQFFMISLGKALSGGGDSCPFPSSAQTTPLEQYIIEPENNGGEFSYSEAGDLQGANPVGTGSNDMSIAGHGVRIK